MPLLRREFLLASSAAASAVVFAGCVPPPREVEGESRVLLAEDLLSAYDNWYATACRGCSAGCGAIVRVVDGRARKAEGNPEHPVNRGKLCARGQALVQEQYHPDRLQGPLQRDRSSGGFQPVTWSSALDALVARLSDLHKQGRAGDVALITPPLDAHQALLVDLFARAYGLDWLVFEPISEAPLRAAVQRVFGFDQLPWFDIRNARTVLSFGADFLGGWLSQVRFGLEYGIFRQGSYGARDFQPHHTQQERGRLIHVDTHFSTTAASADEWIWVRPGTEGTLALSLAQALGANGLDGYAPDQVAATTGVDADRIRRLASELRDGQPSLVIGGGLAGAYTQGTETLTAILSLNVLLDNVGKPGGIVPPQSSIADLPSRTAGRPLSDWQDLVARMNNGREQAVLVLGGANPVHGLPRALGFGEALQRTPFVASFASFADDTAMLADMILPSSLPLEDWGDALPEPGVDASTLTFQQPVVQALFDTRSVWDVLLALADELGQPIRQAMPWATFKDFLQESLGPLHPADTSVPQFWTGVLQHGGIFTGAAPSASPPANTTAPPVPPVPAVPPAQFAGDQDQYPFYLVVFPHNTLGTGHGAHLPWLQAAPDPVTSVTWQTWVEVHTDTAANLGLSEGDIATIESPRGRLEVPVYVSPAAPPDVLSIPLGQGHLGVGRWANRRGINPMQLLEPLVDAASGALAYGSTRVRLSKTGRHIALPKLEGMAPARQLPGQQVLEVVRS